jgi:hypothetical protein
MTRRVVALFLVLAASGCGEDHPTNTVAPTHTPLTSTQPTGPIPPQGRFTVNGDVFDSRTGAIAGASVNLWIHTGSFGYSYWWANGPLGSGVSGCFVAANIPGAQISVWAFTPGFLQPCAVSAAVTDNVEVDVELVSQASLEADARLPRTASGPILSCPAWSSRQPQMDGCRSPAQPFGRRTVSVSLWRRPRPTSTATFSCAAFQTALG